MDYSQNVESFFDKYYAHLVIYVSNIVKNDEDAHDIVQDVFVHILERQHSLQLAPALFFRSARNAALNYITAKRNQMKLSIDTVESTLVYSDNVEENLEYTERMERIYRAIDSLPAKTKEILKKIYIENRSYQEVADEMNIALNTVKSHMTMARNALRKYPGIYLFLIFLEWRQLFF